jgi:hypothetical protein
MDTVIMAALRVNTNIRRASREREDAFSERVATNYTGRPDAVHSLSMAAPTSARPGRNEPCHCGSGRKYKHCCLEKDDAKAAAARAKAAEEAATESSAEAAAPAARATKPQTHQPWKATTSRGFIPRSRTPRKVGGS